MAAVGASLALLGVDSYRLAGAAGITGAGGRGWRRTRRGRAGRVLIAMLNQSSWQVTCFEAVLSAVLNIPMPTIAAVGT